MIVLRDLVEIEAEPQRVFEWFRHLEDNYEAWHPSHVASRYVRGHGLEAGSVLHVEEYLHGKLHRLDLEVTEVEEGRGFEYRALPGVHGRFRMRPVERGTELLAELDFGWRFPLVGRLIDAVARWLLSRRLDALRRHMREEGLSLRELLTAESYPA